MGIQNLREVAASTRTEAEAQALRPRWTPFQYVRNGKVLAEIAYDFENEDGDSFFARFYMLGTPYGDVFTEFWRAKSWVEKQIKERGL